jgi:hypothetical protein
MEETVIIYLIAWTVFMTLLSSYLFGAMKVSKTLEKNFLQELQAKDAEIEALKKHINQSRSEAKEPTTDKP